MYRILLIMLVLTALIQVLRPEIRFHKIVFWLLAVIMIFMQAFRYGQGIDYWGYRTIYASAPYKRGFPLFWYTCWIHGEVGFKFLINIFTNLGISATVFYGLFGTTIMIFVIIAIKRYSPYENLSLLLFYPTFYLTYVFSGIRQAMVTAVFLAFGLKLLQKEKYVKYVLVTLLCASVHAMSLIFLILLPVKWIKEKWVVIGVPVAWVGGLLLALTPLHNIAAELTGIIRLNTVEISLGGLGERSLMFAVITGIYWYGEKKNDRISFFYKIYGIGYLVAVAGMVTAYGSHRITMPLKAVEMILIPMLLAECGRKLYRQWALYCVVSVSVIMVFKNLNYYDTNYNMFTYPYVSLWSEKTEFHQQQEEKMLRQQEEFDDKYEAGVQ